MTARSDDRTEKAALRQPFLFIQVQGKPGRNQRVPQSISRLLNDPSGITGYTFDPLLSGTVRAGRADTSTSGIDHPKEEFHHRNELVCDDAGPLIRRVYAVEAECPAAYVVCCEHQPRRAVPVRFEVVEKSVDVNNGGMVS